jgi:alpha-L-arabinofuranosidase
MRDISRRKFLKSASQTGLVMSAAAMGGRLATAQASTTRVTIDVNRQIAPVSHELFGSFLEQLGRAIYQGIYDAGSKLSDSQGFRKDVLAEVRELQVPIVRWPGGNFVSGYHWLDGVGPRDKRPTVLDRAWNTL